MSREYAASFATGPQQLTTTPRFNPDFWNVSGPASSYFNIISAPNKITFLCELNTTADFVGLIWTSKDYLSHPLLQYGESHDYSNITLSFNWTCSSNLPGLITGGASAPAFSVLYDGSVTTVASLIGDTVLHVASTSSPVQIANGQTLTIGFRENAVVQSFTATTITFTAPLTVAHPISSFAQTFAFVSLASIAAPGYTDFSASLALNFDTASIEGGGSINTRQIERVFIGMNPPGYSNVNPLPLAGGTLVGQMVLTNIQCTVNAGASPNASLSLGVIPNPIDAWVSVADDYSLACVWTPARLVAQYVQLGYRSCVDMYISASRYFSTIWNAGQGIYIVDSTKTVNAPTVAWLTDLIARFQALNMPFTLALSFEIYTPNCPNFWGQADWNGNPAHTGYTPSTTLMRFMAAAPRAWLISVFAKFASLMPTTGNYTIQIGEPTWWFGAASGQAGVGPCLFDIDTKTAYNVATGRFAPEIDSVMPYANLTLAQQQYVTYCGDQMGVFTDAITVAVKAANPNVKVSVLWYADGVLAEFGNGYMQVCNCPQGHWAYGSAHAPDIMELENYGQVVPTFIPEDSLFLFNFATGPVSGGNLGYPLKYIRYYSGYATNFTATANIPAYFYNMTNAVNYATQNGIQQTLLWAFSEVWQTGYVLSYAEPDALG
jgi:hypothetical protein